MELNEAHRATVCSHAPGILQLLHQAQTTMCGLVASAAIFPVLATNTIEGMVLFLQCNASVPLLVTSNFEKIMLVSAARSKLAAFGVERHILLASTMQLHLPVGSYAWQHSTGMCSLSPACTCRRQQALKAMHWRLQWHASLHLLTARGLNKILLVCSAIQACRCWQRAALRASCGCGVLRARRT